MKKDKIFFKGLAEIRAIAAFSVMFHHIELYKYRSGLDSLYSSVFLEFISHLGKNGVNVFFVLSGFLISFLLLAERKAKDKVNVKKFYLRRILRIWPLYYLIVLISFTFIPFLALNFDSFQNETHYYNKIISLLDSPYSVLVLFIFFIPNLALKIKPAVVGASQTWSVGVEEQFYIIWPHLFNIIKNKNYLLYIFLFISLLPFFNDYSYIVSYTLHVKLKYVLDVFPIHYMAIGGLGAYFLFYYKEKVSKLFNNKTFAIIILTLFILALFYPFNKIMFGFLAILLIILITQIKYSIRYNLGFLKKMGAISYGIYMYHPLVMYICFSFFNSVVPIENILLYNIAVYTSIFTVTILISYTSFYYFEKRFIDLKNKKFTVIISGEN